LKSYIEALSTDVQEKLKKYMEAKKEEMKKNKESKKTEMEKLREEYKNMTDEEKEAFREKKMTEIGEKINADISEIEGIVGDSDEAKAYIAQIKELNEQKTEKK